jgi:hypothetical protein
LRPVPHRRRNLKTFDTLFHAIRSRQESWIADQFSGLKECDLLDPATVAGLEDKLDDLLQPENLKAWVEAARDAESGVSGEAPRRRLRASLALYLSCASRRIDQEIRNAAGRTDSLESLIHERMERRNHAAAEVGAEDQVDLLRTAQAVDPTDLLSRFESDAIAPLDDAIANASRVVRPLSEHDEVVPFGTFPAVVRKTGATLGVDPDSYGPVLLHKKTGTLTSCRALTAGAAGERGVLFCGEFGGPGGLWKCLEMFGQAARSAAVRRLRGDQAWTGADPAFSAAAGVLFRRLALNPAFTTCYGPTSRSRWLQDLQYQEAVSPRKLWARLHLALTSARGHGSTTGELWKRAAGEEPPPEAQDWLDNPDPVAADLLRGEVLGVMLEDTVMTRFGRGWFENRAAGSFLLEIWEADPEETAESMASSLGLGTIDSAPILDRFRP